MALLFRWAQACNPQNNIAPSPRARGYRQNHGSRAMGRGQPSGKLRNTQNKDTGQQPVRTPLVDRCGRTENSIENSRLDRLGDLGYALAPKTTRPTRQHPQELPYLPAAMGIPFTATLPIFPSSHRDGCQAASVSRAATWLGRRRGHSPAQNAVFRKGPYAECAFP